MKVLLLIIGGVVAFITFAIWYERRPESIAIRQAQAREVEAEKLPRKVNESNGCEVWAFKPNDRWLYFTRCAAKTETVNTWNVCRLVNQGKSSRTECTPHSATISQEPK